MTQTTEIAKVVNMPIYPSKEAALVKIRETTTYKAIQTEIAKFNKQATEIIKQGAISSDVGAKSIDNLLSEIKKYVKSLDKKGMYIRRPYNDTTSIIKEIFDDLTKILSGQIPDLTGLVTTFIKEKEEKARIEQKAKNDQQATLTAWVKRVSVLLQEANTVEEINKIGVSHIKPFSVDLFPLLDQEVVIATLTNVKNIGKDMRDAIINKTVSDPDIEEVSPEVIMDQVIEAIAESAEASPVDMKPTIKFNTAITKRLSYRNWKTDQEVDKKFMSVDPAKVKAYLDIHREEIKADIDKASKGGAQVSVVKHGLEFYYEEGTRTT